MTNVQSSTSSRTGSAWRRVTGIAAFLIAGSFSTAVCAAERAPHVNKMVEKLAAGQVAVTPDDWTWIDMEHGPYNAAGLRRLLGDFVKKRQPNGQLHSTPITRIPMDGWQADTYGWMVKQVLDQGIYGIIFPHVDTAEQARKAVEAMRHPQARNSKYPEPKGKRGHGGVPQTYAMAESEYIYKHGDLWPLNPEGDLVAFMMIESVEGVKNAREIMNTPGVTALLVAPNDLSLSIGVGPTSVHSPGGWPFHPETEAAIESVLKTCKAEKKICGFAATKGDVEVNKRREQGFNFIARFHVPGSQLLVD